MDRGEVEVSRRDPAALVAERQRGVVSRRQLLAAGVGAGAIDHRIATGRLHPVHRGIYLVGHTVPPPLAAETAALLACGRGAILSHRTAARLWEIRDDREAEIDVTVVGNRRAQRRGIRVHHTEELPRSEIRIRDGLPITTPERTVLDLASMLPRRQLAAVLDTARAKRLLHAPRLLSLLAKYSRRRGTQALRALLQAPDFTRSEAERRLLALIQRAGLPRPRTNTRVAGHEVDAHWPARLLIVEVDSYAFHSDREAFERDRRRDAELVAVGQRVLRVTWRQIVDEPEAVAVRLARALERGRNV